MKTQGGFTLLENEKDVKNWLNKQKVTRTITKLQVHHMDLPNYSTWEKTDKKVFAEPHFGRTQSLDSYGKSTWHDSDGHGHFIAQHFNVFPDGKITTGRNLNSTPIGIRKWNTNAICIEIYGCFDKGHDKMTSAQKKAVIYLYGELCKRFDIPVNTSHIRPHCWFTAGGTYLGKYNPSRSAKTCPGTAFWGYGCSPDGFSHFIKDVKNYVDGKKAEPKKEFKSEPKKEFKKEHKPADNHKNAEVKEAPKAEAQPKEEPFTEEQKEVIRKDIKAFLDSMFGAMSMEVKADITFDDEENSVNVDLSGDNMGVLIGKRGQTLDSIQYLTSLVVNKGNAGYVRVKVDTENYRARRKETLENLAKNIAFKVKRTKKPVFLEPMNPYERRVIHSALQNDPLVSTHSEGEEPYRKVVVTLKKQ